MEGLIPWLTPALIVGPFEWVPADARSLSQPRSLSQQMTGLRKRCYRVTAYHLSLMATGPTPAVPPHRTLSTMTSLP